MFGRRSHELFDRAFREPAALGICGVGRLVMANWPGPVLRMLASEITPAQALAAADDKDPAARRGSVCVANFYAGEVVLAQGNREEARHLFHLAADECPPTFVERQFAVVELRLLDPPN